MNNFYLAKYSHCILNEKENYLICDLISSDSTEALSLFNNESSLNVNDLNKYKIDYEEIVNYLDENDYKFNNSNVNELDEKLIFSLVHETLNESIMLIQVNDFKERNASLIDIINVKPKNFYVLASSLEFNDDFNYKFTDSKVFYIENNNKYKFDFDINFDEVDEFILFEDYLFINFELIEHSKLTLASEKDLLEVNFNNLIKGFKDFLVNEKLYFSDEDIYNFCYSVLSLNLVILEGVSGIGKSKLPLEFAKYLNIREENKELLFLPISPSYIEPSDILGYYNTAENMFVESETEFASFLVHASQNKDKLHIIIFDEMNLSKIEHYFAPFISMLEKEDNRFIKLYSDTLKPNNSDLFPSKIEIFDNIRFIGTINEDETTENISLRLIDRAFIINLHKTSFVSNINRTTINYSNSYLFNLNSLKLDTLPYDFFETCELEFFDSLNELIAKIDKKIIISYRTLNNITKYLSLVDGDYSVYFDLAIKQTILRKLFMNNKLYYNKESEIKELINYLTKSDLSSFKYSIDYINENLAELYNG